MIGVIFILICHISKSVEGFTWEKDQQLFVEKTNLNTPNTIYNIDILKKNVSTQDTDQYLKTKKWPWDESTKTRYEKAFETNPYIRTTTDEGIIYAQRIYPQYAINYILDQQIQASNKREESLASKKVYMEKLYPSGIGIFGFTSGLF